MALDRLKETHTEWKTAPEYTGSCSISAERFLQVTDLLLENPNLNSTHLFRADILYDSARRLKTVSEKERFCLESTGLQSNDKAADGDDREPVASSPPVFEGAIVRRRVLRKLIPRKPQLDRPLDQWCYVYSLNQETDGSSGSVVVYQPQVDAEVDMPWYHPPVKSLAYVRKSTGAGTTLSVHFLPFSTSPDPLPSRTNRIFISLLQTFLRLAKNQPPGKVTTDDGYIVAEAKEAMTSLSLAPSALKDTILPQHIVQDTYTRLKERYAKDLISRWVEKTEPVKHVFEDLAIAAFVIELWKQMYPEADTFPGFVDIACGNGVLTYVLVKEGYRGLGFDARRRSTWDVLELDSHLDEMLCIPQPFLDHIGAEEINGLQEAGVRVHNGIFEPGTFIISNHADELTPWTPLLATLSSPDAPLPFLAIPCCSHALSGARHRYSPKETTVASSFAATEHSSSSGSSNNDTDKNNTCQQQPASGDLKALRAAKANAANHTDDTSMYACLTKKVVSLAREVGIDVELTLMRIPSTRNIGVVGNRKRAAFTATTARPTDRREASSALKSVHELLRRECAVSGGIAAAARCWVERAQKLQTGRGRGKVNLGRPPGEDLIRV